MKTKSKERKDHEYFNVIVPFDSNVINFLDNLGYEKADNVGHSNENDPSISYIITRGKTNTYSIDSNLYGVNAYLFDKDCDEYRMLASFSIDDTNYYKLFLKKENGVIVNEFILKDSSNMKKPKGFVKAKFSETRDRCIQLNLF